MKESTPESRRNDRAARRVIVIGGGVAGLTTALELALSSIPVLLISATHPRRAPSGLDQDGFNAVLDTFGENDSTEAHLQDSIVASDFLAAKAPLRSMVRAAPDLLSGLVTMGVPLARTSSGGLDALRGPGSSARRTVFSGSTTGQQVLHALEDQVRRRQAEPAKDRFHASTNEPLIEMLEAWDFLSLVLDDNGRAVGVVARDKRNGNVKPFRGEAVCLATGGWCGMFSNASSSLQSAGGAIATAFRQGAILANPEFVQFRPLAIRLADKSFPLSDLLRSNGARLFQVPSDKEGTGSGQDRTYFLERDYGKRERELSQPEASRAMLRAGRVFLDAEHLDAATAQGPFGALLSTLRRLAPEMSFDAPIPVNPAADLSLGGLWVDHEANASGELVMKSPRNHSTNIPGLYAVGECAHQYKGAGVLTGNALLLCVFGGRVAGTAIRSYVESLEKSAWDLPPSLYEKSETRERDRSSALLERKAGDENPFTLLQELGLTLTEHGGMERSAAPLKALHEKLLALTERATKAACRDRSPHFNQTLEALSRLDDALLLARSLTMAASARPNGKGAHYRTDSADATAEEEPRQSLLQYKDEPRFVQSFEYTGVSATHHIDEKVDLTGALH